MPDSVLSTLWTGDALVQRPPAADVPDVAAFVDLVRSVDVAMTNLEVCVDGAAGTPAWGIGIHLAAPPEVPGWLRDVGFGLLAGANNHALDFGLEGLRRHRAAAVRAGLPLAGVGDDLASASAPVVTMVGGRRVALVACASSLGAGWPAADAGPTTLARAGVNPLRFSVRYTLDADRWRALEDVAEVLGLAARTDYEVEMGYVGRPAGPGARRLFDGVVERGERSGVTTACDSADLARITTAVRECDADVVAVYLHTQESEGDIHRPPAFVRELAHACVDAGAHVVAMSGPHVLRGVELYRGRPVLYSLGNLWFQYEDVPALPPELLESVGLPDAATSRDFTGRSLTGLRDDVQHWRSVAARVVTRADGASDVTLHPLTLGHEDRGWSRGCPRVAQGDEAAAVASRLAELSAPFGTEVVLDTDSGVARVSAG